MPAFLIRTVNSLYILYGCDVPIFIHVTFRPISEITSYIYIHTHKMNRYTFAYNIIYRYTLRESANKPISRRYIRIINVSLSLSCKIAAFSLSLETHLQIDFLHIYNIQAARTERPCIYIKAFITGAALARKTRSAAAAAAAAAAVNRASLYCPPPFSSAILLCSNAAAAAATGVYGEIL